MDEDLLHYRLDFNLLSTSISNSFTNHLAMIVSIRIANQYILIYLHSEFILLVMTDLEPSRLAIMCFRGTT